MERLEAALQWLGLEHGRVASYKKLLAEYYEGQRSNEHFFAFYQAMDALSIFDTWKDTAGDFPGLQDKISVIFKKGPLLPQGENASANSNRPRNDGFVYILGGKFLHGQGITIISVDGIPNKRADDAEVGANPPSDILLLFRDTLIRVECKRPMNSNTLAANIETASSQIATSRQEKSYGVIAVDVSKLIEQPGQYLEASSLDAGSNYLTDRVADILTPLAKQYCQEWLLGLIGFASIPLVATARSVVLQQDGRPYEIKDLRTAAVSWVTIKNKKCPKSELLRELQLSYMRIAHSVPSNSVPMT